VLIWNGNGVGGKNGVCRVGRGKELRGKIMTEKGVGKPHKSGLD